MFKRTFLKSEQQRSTIKVHSGADAFVSPGFSDLFERSALPADVGGTLTSGADGHCCGGVELPAVSDAEAIWGLYQGLLSPSLKAQPNKFDSVIARHHRGSPKVFACFLSHDDQVCAIEAGTLKEQLESLLDANIGKIMLPYPSPTYCAL